MTLIGSSVNLIIGGLVSSALERGALKGMAPLGVFDPIWIGLPATLAGLAFMILLGNVSFTGPDKSGWGKRTKTYLPGRTGGRGKFLFSG